MQPEITQIYPSKGTQKTRFVNRLKIPKPLRPLKSEARIQQPSPKMKYLIINPRWSHQIVYAFKVLTRSYILA